MKKYKQPKSHVISVHVKVHKFHGEPIIHSFWLTDGKPMKTRDTQKTIKLISHSMVISEEAVTESMEKSMSLVSGII